MLKNGEKSLLPLFNLWCEQKNIKKLTLCQSILLSYRYISYLCDQTSMFLDFQMIILLVPSVASRLVVPLGPTYPSHKRLKSFEKKRKKGFTPVSQL